MKILLVSRFPPSLGGLETMGVLIAREWGKDESLEVKVVTDVPGDSMPELSCELVRCPSWSKLFKLYKWADAIFFNHCYLRLAAPMLLRRKPYVVSMSGIVETPLGATLSEKLKTKLLHWLLARADVNIAACEYVKFGNGVPASVIPNPYDSLIYHNENGTTERPFHFFFGGRINQTAKGCLDLIDALADCREQTGRDLILSVAGDGPDLAEMKKRAAAAGMESCIRFLGVLKGSHLADEMRRHQVIVVPSRYQEPIGIICLEGIACGCIAIGSSGGGLGESVGPCGFTFQNGDVPALADAMKRAISLKETDIFHIKKVATKHLAEYHPKLISERYLAALRIAMTAVGAKPGREGK